jgi:cell division protein FtsB
MASASQSSAARSARSQQAAVRPREITQRLPRSRVGWDRKFRAVMVVVFALVGWIGVNAALSMYSAQQQASQEHAVLRSLELQNRQLRARKQALSQPATIVRDARHLGMVLLGERPYVVIPASAH